MLWWHGNTFCISGPLWANPQITRSKKVKSWTYWSLGRHVRLEAGDYIIIIILWVSKRRDFYSNCHDDVIKWKHFSRYWPFVMGIQWLPVDSSHKGPGVRSFDVFFDLRLNKQLSKQLRRWHSRSLWYHCNVCDVMALYGSHMMMILVPEAGISGWDE